MRDSKVINAIAGLITAGALVSIYLTVHGGLAPRLNAAPHEALGEVMAEQALALRKGGPITLITRDTSSFKNPATDVQLASFKKVLRKARVGIDTVLTLEIDPLRPVEVPSSDFFQIIRKTPKGGVVVSFMGPPVFTETQWRQLGEIQPAIVALCSANAPEMVNLKWLFEKGLLHVAVLARRDSPGPLAQSRDRRTCFEQCFQTITPANIGSLPSPAGTSPDH